MEKEYLEALECLEDIYRNAVFISDYDVFGKQRPTNISPETNKSISVQCDTIKQALLKAQEPKKYLKWEDLEFKEEEEIMKVLLNGEMYILKAYKDYILDISIVELEKTDGIFVLYINQCNFQFFNDLHLERVEE